MNAAQAKQIKITDYLNGEGISPMKIQGDDFWYCSPLRQETTPSFKVNVRANVWYDHGLGQGGNILDLVMAMHHLDNISQALSKLSGKMPSSPAESFSFQQQRTSSGIAISKITPVTNSALVEYIKSRHIDIEIAGRYCKDIYYTVNGKNYFSVGFGNDCGGYELSYPYFKGSVSPKGITTIRQGKDTCLIFEGFWDFLSYLTIKGIRETQHDVVVLNSVANLSKALEFISPHKEVFACLDNDEAGKRAVQELKTVCKNVTDQSVFYANFKDLNDYLCRKNQVQEKKKSKGFKR
jgi:DNA primase